MDMDLTGKLALVSGSTKGIGLATATGLAGMSARVIINGRGQAAIDAARDKILAAHPGADVLECVADLGTAEGCSTLTAAHPSVDILVNNVGIYSPKPFLETEDSDWEDMFSVNVMSGVRLTRHYLGGMLQRDWGRVVFISSESAIYVPKEMVHYGVSKSAQLVIARGASEMTKGTNVTVNSVLPGPTWVEMQEIRLGERARQQNTTVENLKRQTFEIRRPSSLIQRYLEMDEVANMVCYVCSKASSGSNGAVFRVEGGIITNPF